MAEADETAVRAATRTAAVIRRRTESLQDDCEADQPSADLRYRPPFGLTRGQSSSEPPESLEPPELPEPLESSEPEPPEMEPEPEEPELPEEPEPPPSSLPLPPPCSSNLVTVPPEPFEGGTTA